jgi:hypothetical protein
MKNELNNIWPKNVVNYTTRAKNVSYIIEKLLILGISLVGDLVGITARVGVPEGDLR